MLADQKQSTVVVDVRNWEAYDRAHIAGAICIPLPELRPGDPLIGSADRVVVYGESFDSPLSPAAAKRLIAEGYANVFDFRGGLDYWIEQGGPVQSLEPVQAPDAAADTRPLPGQALP
jgi:rhodanese-related sulfurtransferase